MLTCTHACSKPRWGIFPFGFLAKSNRRSQCAVFYLDGSCKDLNQGKKQPYLEGAYVGWVGGQICGRGNMGFWNDSAHFLWLFLANFLCPECAKIFFFLLFGHICGIWFLDQRLSLSRRSDLHHSCGNAHCTGPGLNCCRDNT